MSKIAFIYPGQGAQKCGMGKDFYENKKTIIMVNFGKFVSVSTSYVGSICG